MIYFLFDRDSDLIKIGFSRDEKTLERRLKTLGCGNGSALEILRVEEGDRLQEASVHRIFQRLRVKGEWFRNAGLLADYLKNWL